jgi:molecular chaperone GrpE
MFFKKKKVMNDNLNDKNASAASATDNLSDMNETQIGTEGATTPAEDASENASGGFAMVEVNEERISDLEKELHEQKEKYVRLLADFDNYKRRSNKEFSDLSSTAGKEIIASLLVVLDDMDRAGKQLETSTDIKAITDGVSLVFNKFRSIMQKRGLKAMESKNEKFNPDLHEAIAELPVQQEKMQGVILETVEPGYYLNDKLIRFAKVVIGKKAE